MNPDASDRADWLPEPAKRPPRVPISTRSLHLTMRDGVRIAVDIHLSGDGGVKRPTILRQTRYHRGKLVRWPWGLTSVEALIDHPVRIRERFVASGYVWIDVCARGSGASFGTRPCPWSPDEIADGAEVIEWITQQPWSNGRVGSTGVSYDGTAADFAAVNQHPALKAIAPRFSLFDVFTDIAFPGGLHLASFTQKWARFNRFLDDNRMDSALGVIIRHQVQAGLSYRTNRFVLSALRAADTDRAEAVAAWVAKRITAGVRPVDDDRERSLLRDAVESHNDNTDVHEVATSVEYRDDSQLLDGYPDATMDFFSPHAHVDQLRASGVAIYSVSGWLDGAYQHAAVKRFKTLDMPGRHLLLGPWDHGGEQNVSPSCSSRKTGFDHAAELLRFFDYHLKDADNGFADAPTVRYFTVGEERWKSADDWPPPCAQIRTWYLGPERGLCDVEPASGVDEYRVDPQVGTGCRSRWDTLLGLIPPAGYSDRRALGARLLVYRSAPLERPLEVTGHPLLRLWLSSNDGDARVFAYLEDEHADGRVQLVTEGQLRAVHRKIAPAGPYEGGGPFRTFARADAAPMSAGVPQELCFDLLPISWRFTAGHRIRLALAGADADHFGVASGASVWGVHRGGREASTLELPLVAINDRSV